MTIAREEIFGPVLAVIPYANEDQAVGIANDTNYGLGGYVFAGSRERGYDVAAGSAPAGSSTTARRPATRRPMGGYSQSGNGRSMGVFGLEEYLEVKAMFGFRTRQERCRNSLTKLAVTNVTRAASLDKTMQSVRLRRQDRKSVG